MKAGGINVQSGGKNFATTIHVVRCVFSFNFSLLLLFVTELAVYRFWCIEYKHRGGFRKLNLCIRYVEPFGTALYVQ